MAFQVLSTKLYIPPLQAGLVKRPGLVQRLENGYLAGKRVTLVSAPAGFGKTTIIREWIAATDSKKPFGWFSLDEEDNDPVRFLIYLVTALQKIHGGIGRSVQSALRSSQIPPLSDLVEILINEISAEEKPFLIVLDDYHLIKRAEVHALVQLFLKRQPEILHWVIITREDPPLPLPRMRVQGQISEIRERDLRFTLSEAQTFLLETMGLALSSDDIGKLKERTEGWAAGMQLAALALEEYPNQAERHTFIEAFTGSNRLIVDYLISEVLQRQPVAMRQFLLNTSILERFCADLCDHVVTDEANPGHSQPILESLEQANMFLVSLDNQRHWYRYHHLFSEMLFHSLRQTSAGLIPELHRKASQWFETKGFIPEAVKHSLASRDWDLVSDLLDRHALPLIFQGYGSVVIDWCREIPKARLEKAPDICIYYAWALVLTFRNDFMDAVDEKLQLAEQAIKNPELPRYAQVGQGGAQVPYREWVIGHTCVIRSQILMGHSNTEIDPQELISLSLKGLELLPDVELTFRSTCKINLALAQLMQNDPSAAQKALEDSLPFQIKAGNFLGAVTNIFYQARLAFYMGLLDRAESLCLQWKIKFAEMAGSSAMGYEAAPEVPAIRGLDIVRSLILLERDQPEEAEKLIVQTLNLLGWASWMELHGFIELARLRHQSGDISGAQETIQRMSRMGPQHAACAEALQVFFDVKQSLNEPSVRHRAETWTTNHAPNPKQEFALGIGPYHRDTEYFSNLVWARLKIALGHPEHASMFIGPALKNARGRGLVFRVAELSIAQALIYDGLGDSSAALEVFLEALEIAETCGYIRLFDDGPEVDRLLQQVIEHGAHSRYAGQLWASFKRMPVEETIAATTPLGKKEHPELVDPLSERELEVIKLLAESLTPSEVAKLLFLSPYTLKAHTQNIYSKLEVHSRIEAINKARKLGLI